MKKIYLFVVLITTSLGYAQTFPIEYSDPLDNMACNGCTFTIVEDAGNPVGSVAGGGEAFDNAKLQLAQNLDLSDDNNNTITFRVKPTADYGTRTHAIKFEVGTGANFELTFTTTGTAWQNISLDFPAGLGTYRDFVIFTDFNNSDMGTYLFDDFAGGTNVTPPPPPPMPSGPAPTPTTPDASVFRLYGDTGTYSNNMVYDYSFGTLAGEPDLDASAAVNLALQFNFGVAGWGSGQNASSNVSTAQFVHFDYWATNATDFRLFLISKTGAAATVETFYEIGTAQPLISEAWTSVTLPIAVFTAQGFDVNNYLQYKYDVASVRPGTVYIDNLYFSDVPPTALSINEFETAGFKVYPNPSNNEWTVKANTMISSMLLYDVLGKQIMSSKPNAFISKIDASGLAKGVYVMKVTANNQTSTFKLIKD